MKKFCITTVWLLIVLMFASCGSSHNTGYGSSDKESTIQESSSTLNDGDISQESSLEKESDSSTAETVELNTTLESSSTESPIEEPTIEPSESTEENILTISKYWILKTYETSNLTMAMVIDKKQLVVVIIARDNKGGAYYWSGTYDAPQHDMTEYTWTSKNKFDQTSDQYCDDEYKQFTYKDGMIYMAVTDNGKTTYYPFIECDADTINEYHDRELLTSEAETTTENTTDNYDNWYEQTYNEYSAKLEEAYNTAVKDIQAKVDEGGTYQELTDLIAERVGVITDIGAEGVDNMAEHASNYPLTTNDYMTWSVKLTNEATQCGVNLETAFMTALYQAMLKEALGN